MKKKKRQGSRKGKSQSDWIKDTSKVMWEDEVRKQVCRTLTGEGTFRMLGTNACREEWDEGRAYVNPLGSNMGGGRRLLRRQWEMWENTQEAQKWRGR